MPDNILEALDLLDEPVKAALIHQCFLDAIKAPKRSTEGKYLQRYLDQAGLEIGPGSDQSLKAFTTLLKCYQDIIKVLGILVEVHHIKARWRELLQAASNYAKENAQAEITLGIRDLVDTYQQYQSKYTEFANSGLYNRSCLYSIRMNIVSDIVDWHNMISGTALTTAAGCEAIMDSTMDPGDYGQYLTTALESISVQSLNQRQLTDPNRHSTPHTSRDSFFNTDLTIISKFPHPGITGSHDISHFPQQTGQPQTGQGGPPQAGPSNMPEGPNAGCPVPAPQGPNNHQPPSSTQGLLAVSQPGAVLGQTHKSTGLINHPVFQLAPSTTAPVVGPLGATSTGYIAQPVTSSATNTTPSVSNQVHQPNPLGVVVTQPNVQSNAPPPTVGQGSNGQTPSPYYPPIPSLFQPTQAGLAPPPQGNSQGGNLAPPPSH